MSSTISPPPRAVPSPWKTRPLFVSSTFRDMHRERDWLASRVFPRLREELAPRLVHLEPVDLRLGVAAERGATEEDRETLVLKVCLDEIERSRPFLLVILGDRWGWAPPGERLEATARERGIAAPPAGTSVTALEIEFGLLAADPAQVRRAVVLLRRPLPYQRMPEPIRAAFCDAHSPDPEIRLGHRRLQALKDRLRSDPRLAGRVHEYSAGWDERTQQVCGLEEFGDLAFRELWAALDDATRGAAAPRASGWEDEERAALAELVEHRGRGFVGRADLLQRLAAFARSPAPDAGGTTGAVQAACVVGPPGAGKSALVARLHQELAGDPRLLVLTAAAGATPRGSSVDATLRRFIQELGAFLQEEVSLPRFPSHDQLDDAFHALLQRASASRRVVVLLDALDQLEQTARGRHLTWLRAGRWPAGARLIATALPGPAAEALARLSAAAPLPLPALTSADAEEIGRQVWARHHRALPSEVSRVLREKARPGGEAAAGNPLWLTLALEQLGLLDADDFSRAEQRFSGSPTERMAALLLETADRLPAEVTELYGWLLEQNERTFGRPVARAFATALALGRTGWRENDLVQLVPTLSAVLSPDGERATVDDLALASLRRGFRAHVVRRGENGLLDVFHAQMRRAVLERYAAGEDVRRRLHAAVADHLETLPASDPLRRHELMHHLLAQRDPQRAARAYAGLDPREAVRLEDPLSPPWTLADWIGAGEPDRATSSRANPNLLWVLGWLEWPALPPQDLHRLVSYMTQGILPGLAQTCAIETRTAFVEVSCRCLEHLLERVPGDAELRHDLSAELGNLGDLLRDEGLLEDALAVFHRSLAIRRQLVAESPTAQQRRDLSVCLDKLADALARGRQLDAAREAFEESLAIRAALGAADPLRLDRQRELAASLQRMCQLDRARGDTPHALAAIRHSLRILELLVEQDPESRERQRDLAVGLGQLGETLRAALDLPGALEAFQRSLAIRRRLLATDPASVAAQTDLSVGLELAGETLIHLGDLPAALEHLGESVALSERLARADPGNAERQRALASGLENLADVRQRRREPTAALTAQRDALALRERLVAQDPAHLGWRRGLAHGLFRLGDLLRDAQDAPAARDAYRRALAVRQGGPDDPDDLPGRRSLALLHNRLALSARTLGDPADTELHLRACLDVLEDLKRRGMALDPQLARLHEGLVEAFARRGAPG